MKLLTVGWGPLILECSALKLMRLCFIFPRCVIFLQNTSYLMIYVRVFQFQDFQGFQDFQDFLRYLHARRVDKIMNSFSVYTCMHHN
jgi:predicted N-acyltransferase